jgi:hypothetical protein
MSLEIVVGRRRNSKRTIGADRERRPHEKTSTHDRAKAGEPANGRYGWQGSSTLAHEGTPARDRDRSIESRGREKNCEGEAMKNSKEKKARKEIRTKRPSWIGKIDECARELHIGPRYIYDLAKQGFPRVSPGRYNIPKCFRFYVRYLQRKLVERAHPETGDGAIAKSGAGETRHKLLSIEAELKQIELAEKREQLISIERVEKDLAKIVTEVRTRILALPPRLAAEILGETDLAVSQVRIERSLKNALECLSEFNPDEVEAVSSSRSSTRSRTQ